MPSAQIGWLSHITLATYMTCAELHKLMDWRTTCPLYMSGMLAYWPGLQALAGSGPLCKIYSVAASLGLHQFGSAIFITRFIYPTFPSLIDMDP